MNAIHFLRILNRHSVIITAYRDDENPLIFESSPDPCHKNRGLNDISGSHI